MLCRIKTQYVTRRDIVRHPDDSQICRPLDLISGRTGGTDVGRIIPNFNLFNRRLGLADWYRRRFRRRDRSRTTSDAG